MNDKTEFLIWFFGIMVMLLLSIKILLDSQELTCEKCMIEYHSTLPNEQKVYKSENVSLQLMYNEFLEGRCMVTWDENTGFRISKEIFNT